MFTGIIDNLGKVTEKYNNKLKIEILKPGYENINKGESISVNGACLTVEEINKNTLTFSVSQETFARSNLQYIKDSSVLNLERSLKLNDRLSGHIVQGHIDDTGTFLRKSHKGNDTNLTIKLTEELISLTVVKGSIAINGISLTIVNKIGLNIDVVVVPYTIENTNLKYLRPRDKVNVETDIIGKYINNWYNIARSKNANIKG